VNSALKMACAAAAVVVASVACSPVAVAPSSVASSTPVATPSQQAERLTVAGTEVNGPALGLTVELPPDWQAGGSVAQRGTSSPPAGMAFVVSLIDNTFKDPCLHVERSPKVGPTAADAAAALGEIPNLTATAPVQTTIAGRAATYIELTVPAALPCAPDHFYLWQDSPGGDWWVQGLNETARVWILEVGSRRVAILTHAYAGSSADAKAEFQNILDSIVFDSAP
jgi:hypothetical protein